MTSSKSRLRASPWLLAAAVALLWILLVYSLSLQAQRGSHRIAKDDLARLLQAAKPDAQEVLDIFDRATEQILFSVLAPQLILTIFAFFFVAHLTALKLRLNAAERDIQTLRNAALGIEGASIR